MTHSIPTRRSSDLVRDKLGQWKDGQGLRSADPDGFLTLTNLSYMPPAGFTIDAFRRSNRQPMTKRVFANPYCAGICSYVWSGCGIRIFDEGSSRPLDGADARSGVGGMKHPGDGSVGKMRSEEHKSELQSLMHSSYAVLCLKK